MRRDLKKKIKQDELVSSFEQAGEWVTSHVDELKIAGVVVAVLAIGGFALQHFRAERDREAREALASALDIYHAPLPAEGAQAQGGGSVFATSADKYRKVLGDFEGIERRYGSHPVALRARYYAALCKIQLGQKDEAESTLKDLASKREGDRLEPALARLALADLQRVTGRADQAVETYKQLISDRELPLPRDHVLMGLAKLYEDASRFAEAEASYQQVLNEFPGSTYAEEARRQVEYLQARG